MNSLDARVAVEIMGWTACRCLNPNARFSDDFVFQPDDQGRCWCMDVPDRKMQVQHWTADFTPTANLNHARLAWYNLSNEQQEVAARELYRGKSGYVVQIVCNAALDPLKLCQAMLAAKETT